ncbi:hypothetical protein E8E13_001278 [Curvularia kusanoi]|uniref:Uncharacterized protein n=1 Tax=Curvularia kusanoi TaxID=90978 RepID=A0A9P4T3B1_CURKU|nr:hypothetical protein E8E13_001278 [Curvularia kusanoi]
MDQMTSSMSSDENGFESAKSLIAARTREYQEFVASQTRAYQESVENVMEELQQAQIEREQQRDAEALKSAKREPEAAGREPGIEDRETRTGDRESKKDDRNRKLTLENDQVSNQKDHWYGEYRKCDDKLKMTKKVTNGLRKDRDGMRNDLETLAKLGKRKREDEEEMDAVLSKYEDTITD